MSEHTQRCPPPDGPSSDTAFLPPAPDPPSLTRASEYVPERPVVTLSVELPGFEILSELGRGGMGVVYKARQRSLNRLVALKVILGGPLASIEDKARFRIEAEAAARLHHPNIVQVFDVGECAGFSYIALELVEGDNLRKWQGGQPVEPQLAARLVSAVARGVQHAHEQGIVHRDLKPANILLAPVPDANPDSGGGSESRAGALPSGSLSRAPSGARGPLPVAPKVTDFGLAKPLEGGTDLTLTGVACGTPNYMAPEQVRGKASGLAVDVYGLGAVLFELLAGRPPFVGADAAEVLIRILRTQPAGVRKFVRGVPRDLEVIVAKCLEKDPARRYPSARDVADDLERYLAGKPIAARPVGPAERAWRWVKRNPVVAGFLVVSTFGCALTGALALALARSGSDQRGARAAAESARADAEVARELAKAEAAHAVAQRAEADSARARSEAHLRIAREVIRASFGELSGHPRFEDEDFRHARQTLIAQVRPVPRCGGPATPNAPEWLDDITGVSHWLGFLEYLNGNQAGAAAEYRTAAAAAGRWAQLEPQRPEPRARQVDALVNAGNALFNSGQFDASEACYRDAATIMDAVVAERPESASFRQQAVHARGQLAHVLRATNRPERAEESARQELDRATDLVRVCGDAVDNLRPLAAANASLAGALELRQKWDEADRHFVEAIATRDRVRKAAVGPRYAVDYASAVLAHANFLNARGHHDRAADAFLEAVAALEKAQASVPDVNLHCVDLAFGWAQHGEFLRGRSQFAEAERRFTQALELANTVTRRAPGYRLAREAAVTAGASRAHVYNATGRHREAAAEWQRLAAEDPDPNRRTQHELFVLQSHLFAADWKAAATGADALMKADQPAWMWVDLGRVWCLAARQIEADVCLMPADRTRESEAVVAKAVVCLERARKLKHFEAVDRAQWVTGNDDFAPVRGKFDPAKK
ncbi:serine/threonine-protein kinase [Frigoriglobus tundricola]|uniref:Protein kinase domain-containing protein n=1 Tax=Frigoriglobus tundricola TaxID=2774151 RepID=A0A6M5YZU6_9BACT|nr:serine/threonine-protein kinase [Frigoriglobus tundricola]QJW99398.1 hypothetical protein FTUN_7010 [Frigoriglobus tundricola]